MKRFGILAYLAGSWIIMLSSALIGCFTVRLNVELCSDWLFSVRLNVVLCSDWLFHSAAQCCALFWLAVSQCGSMLLCSDWLFLSAAQCCSALIGCFTVLNVVLCSDWLFLSAAQCCALLWLAVSQCGSMLSSALIGCFSVRLNVVLCSDWLFHSAAQCWALLWLAVSQCGSMLCSALIGCFSVRLNVVLCSDWLFHSAAHVALLWLAVFSAAHVELCSDWLFHSAAQCWALLWLAVSQCGSMLYSALIGCFTVRLNVDSALIGCFSVRLNVVLCSDWLFQCGFIQYHRKEKQEGKIYFNTFSRSYIIGLLGNIHAGIREPLLICWALKLLSNARLLYSFTFEIRDRTNSVYTMEKQYLPHIWQEQMLVSGAQDL